MSRPKEQNPLALAFGLALRLARKRLQKEPEEIAQASGMSPVTYKLIEMGRNHPAPSRAIALHAGFQGCMSFEALMMYLNVIATAEEKAADDPNRGQILHERVAAIREALDRADPLRILLSNFIAPIKTFPAVNPSGEKAELSILQCVSSHSENLRGRVQVARLHYEVFNFLTRYKEYNAAAIAPENLNSQNFFRDVPTLYKWLFDGLRENIAQYPVEFDPETSWAWEEKNHRRFVELFVVCEQKPLIDLENLKRYKFDYIWNKEFKRASFVFLDTKPQLTADAAEEVFWNAMKDALNLRSDAKAGSVLATSLDVAAKKTEFFLSNEKQRQTLDEIIDRLSPSKDKSRFNAIWFFRTDDNAFIGAASHIDPTSVKATRIRFLTFFEVADALNKINAVIPGLLGATMYA